MISKILELLGLKEKVDLAQLIDDGALVVDVRTKNEFKSAHADGSINLPLDQLSKNMKKLGSNKERVIITCCASGTRSRMAKSMIQSAGFNEVYNGGSWMKVQRMR